MNRLTEQDRRLAYAFGGDFESAGFAGPAFQLSDKHARAPEYVTLSDTAMQIGRQSVLADYHLFTAWLDQQENVREPSARLGEISTPELFSQVLFNKKSSDEQRKEACELLAERYLSDNEPYVLELAQRAEVA